MDPKLVKQRMEKKMEEFVANSATLKNQMGYTIMERLADAQKRFPGLKLTSYKIRKIYQSHKIKRKSIRYTKINAPPKIKEIKNKALQLGRELRFLKEKGFRII